MTTNKRYLLLFFAPLVSHIIFYMDVAAVQDRAVMRAVFLDGIYTILYLVALKEVVTSNDKFNMAIYLMGALVGTFVGMKLI